jgi:hypothetical protein
MRPKPVILWVVGTLAVLIALLVGCYRFILDWEGKPYCHKAIMGAFMVWMADHGTNVNGHKDDHGDSGKGIFPNVGGSSSDSLATIRDQMGGDMDWAKNYRYVPGLRQDDVGDLVLMYIDRPTRWTWHGQAPPTIFKEKAWMVVPVDFKFGVRLRPQAGPGECSERISLAEFRTRLERTLDFVRTNQRPNWKTVVAEHTKFLDSIGHVDR